jgi:hypothetical protein
MRAAIIAMVGISVWTASARAQVPSETPAESEGREAPQGEAAPEVPAAPRCEVEGRTVLGRLTVPIAGERPIEVRRFNGIARAIVPSSANGPTQLRLVSPLSAPASTRVEPTYVLKRPLDVLSGAVRLTRAARLERVTMGADGVIHGDVVVADGVRIRSFPLPCDALALGEATAPSPPVPPEEGEVPRGRSLSVRPYPGATESVTIDFRFPREVRVGRLAERGAEARVVLSFPSGSTVEGWVDTRALRPATGSARPRTIAARDEHFRERLDCTRDAVGFFRGMGRVQAASPVSPSPGAPAFAEVSINADVVVRTLPDAAWVAIESIPGVTLESMCPNTLDRAFVPRERVQFGRAAIEGAGPRTNTISVR